MRGVKPSVNAYLQVPGSIGVAGNGTDLDAMRSRRSARNPTK